MDKNGKSNNEEENEDLDFDPTKDAFFSDLGDIENEIMGEAYELVEKALSLIDESAYNEAIELLRQSMGLYEQLNKQQEVSALKNKIQEIHLLMEKGEKSLKRKEEKKETQTESLSSEEDLEELQMSIVDDILEEDNKYETEYLLEDAQSLEKEGKYDKAIDKYGEVLEIFKANNNEFEVERVRNLINECKKKKQKEPSISEEKEEQKKIQVEEGKEKDREKVPEEVSEYEQTVKQKQEISNQAYDLMSEGSKLRNEHQFNKAIEKYNEAAQLFEKIDREYEIEKIQNTIEDIEQNKEVFQKELAAKKEKEEKNAQEKKKEEKKLEQKARVVKEKQEKEKIERLQKLQEKKLEEEQIQKEITESIDKAEKLEREYNIALKKGLKEGSIPEVSPYPKIIEIYKELQKKLFHYGWKRQAKTYSDQIKHYQKLQKKDEKLREIEAKKREEKPQEAYQIPKKEESIDGSDKAFERVKKQHEEKQFQEQISRQVDKAENLARGFKIKLKKALKEGEFPEESPYPKIINIYENVREKLVEKEWNEQAKIYENQIGLYQKELKKYEKLREIEKQKEENEEKYQDIYKPRKTSSEKDKSFEKLKEEKKEKEFQEQIAKEVNRAENLVRNFKFKLKKALKEGEFLEESPYSEIIEIYQDVYRSLNKKGWTDQAQVYRNQIKLYQKEYEKFQHLKEVEAQKKEKDKFLEEIYKKPKSKFKKSHKKQKIIETQQEEERIEKKIDELVDKAEKMAREYELELRKGNFEIESPYPEIIEIYKQARDILLEKGWEGEAKIYREQIKLYNQKLEKDRKLKEIEAKKKDKAKKLKEALKTKPKKVEIDQEQLKRIETEEKEEIIQSEITQMVNKAERIAREYELQLKQKNFDMESPYPQIIKIYRKIRNRLNELGWKEQAAVYLRQIQLYKQKQKKVEKLKEVEDQKKERAKQIDEMLRYKEEEPYIDKKLKKEEEARRKARERQQKIANEIFNSITQVEQAVKEYETKVREGIFEDDPPYDKVIEIYQEGKKKFENMGWINQAERLKEAISHYEEQKEKNKNLKEKVERQRKKLEKEVQEQQKLIEEYRKKRKEKERKKEDLLKKEEKQRRYVEEQKEKAFTLMDKAKEELKEQNFDNALNLYQESEEIFRDIEWKEGIEMIQDSKNLIQERKSELKKAKLAEHTQSMIEQEKEKAFNLLEKGKDQFYDYNFDEALKYYHESGEIFHKIDWKEGIKMVEEAKNLVKEKKEKLKELETEKQTQKQREKQKEEALLLMDKGKEELYQENFDQALESYKKSEEICEVIDWKEGLDMVRETIELIKKRKQSLEEEKREAEEISLIKKQKEKAFELMDKGKEELYKQNFDKALEFYEKSKEIVEGIGWKEGLDMVRENQELIHKKKIELKEAEERGKEQESMEKKKEKAFELMEKGRSELLQENFDKALELYQESKHIFLDISWDQGLNMVQESIELTKRKKEEFQQEIKKIQEEKERRLNLEKELEEHITNIQNIKQKQEEEKQKKYLKEQQRKQEERKVSNEALKLLEEGTRLVERRKFDKAKENYLKAKSLFKQIDWQREVLRIENELLVNLKQEKEQAKRLEEYDKQKREERKKLESLIQEAQKQQKELERKEKKEKRKRLMDIRTSQKTKEELMTELELAEMLIKDKKYNQAALKYQERISKLQERGKQEEILDVQNQLESLRELSEVPLIVLSERKPNLKNQKAFKSAYEALDKAQISLSRENYMKAISELSEARFNLNQSPLEQEFLDTINQLIQKYKRKLRTETGEGTKKELRKPKSVSEKKDEDLKEKIKKRREERRKRIQELLDDE